MKRKRHARTNAKNNLDGRRGKILKDKHSYRAEGEGLDIGTVNKFGSRPSAFSKLIDDINR